MKNNQFSNFNLDDLVFDNVSVECTRKTIEILEELDIDIGVHDVSKGKSALRVLPKKQVVGYDGEKYVMGTSDSQVIIQFPKGSRSYISWLDTIETGKYVMNFTIRDSLNSYEGMNSLSIRRLDDQFILHFFSNHNAAQEYSDYIDSK